LREVYEGREEQFASHGSFFSRVLKAASRGSLAAYQTLAEWYADADARFHARRGDRPGVVWLNRSAAELVRQALGPNEPEFFGTHLDPGD
jgi:hypothetical protein